MTRAHFTPLLHQLFQTVGRLEVNQLSDGQLLERFAQGQEEAAFTALVQRHGPLVLGVCRRVLRQNQDAEDVFQATFLKLARQAASIRSPGSIAGWLYRVAYRLAVKVNRRAEQRRTVPLDDMPGPCSMAEPWRDFLAVLDEELHALPEKYRLALVLCYLEGQTRDRAARQLGWSRRTLLRRLQEGRQRLRERLTRRGIALPAALLTVGLTQPARAALALELVQQTVRAAILFATGNELVAQIVPAHVLGLAKGGLQTMTKFKVALALLMIFGVAGWGAGSFRPPAQAADPPQAIVAARPRPAQHRLPESLWADLASPERTRVTRALMALGAAPPSDAVAFLKKRLHPVKDDPARIARLIGALGSDQLVKRQAAAEELEYLGKLVVPYLTGALAAKPSLEMHKRIERILARVKPPGQGPTIMDMMGGNGMGMMGSNGMRQFGGNGMGMMGGNGMGMMAGNGMGMMGGNGMGMMGGNGMDKRGMLQSGMRQFGGMGMGMMGMGYPAPSPPSPPPALWLRAVWSIAVLEQIGTPEARRILEGLAKGAADALPTKEAKAALKRLGKR